MRALLSIILSGALAGSGVAHAQLKDEVDRFKGTRSVIWTVIPGGEGLFSFTSSARYSEGPDSSPTYSAWLTTYGPRFRYSGCNNVYWLLDGQPFKLPMKYEMDSGSGVAIERFFFSGPRETLERIAAAGKVEFKVCNDESALSGADHEGLRQVLEVTK